LKVLNTFFKLEICRQKLLEQFFPIICFPGKTIFFSTAVRHQCGCRDSGNTPFCGRGLERSVGVGAHDVDEGDAVRVPAARRRLVEDGQALEDPAELEVEHVLAGMQLDQKFEFPAINLQRRRLQKIS
jgi:hypothetical protein